MRRLLAPAVAALALAVSQTPSALPIAAAEPLAGSAQTAVQSADIPSTRIVGHNRYSTAAAISEEWSSSPARVYIVGGSSYRDALVAAGRAGVFRSPLLLTKQDSLPRHTAEALKRLSPRQIVVVGGRASVSNSVLEQLAPLAGNEGVKRVSGPDRYKTAAWTASKYRTGRPAALLVNGLDFPNGSVAGLAAASNLPVLLTRGDSLDSATQAALDRLQVGEIIAVGDTSRVTDSVARQAAEATTSGSFRRLDGSNPYEVSLSVTGEFSPGRDRAFVSSGEEFPGAFAGATLAGRDGEPMILTQGDQVPPATQRAVEQQSPASLTFIGGNAVVSPEVVAELTSIEDSTSDPSEPAPAPSPDPADVSTGAYNGMGSTDDQEFLNLVGGMPLTHATSYYTTGNVNDRWPNARDRQRLANGTTVLMGMASKNWQGGGADSFMAWRDIAAGRHDAEIRGWGRKLGALDKEVWFAFDIEPDQKLNQGKVPSSWTPEEYAAATRRISQLVRSEAPKVKFTFWVAGHQKALIDRMYPGDAAVDLICWDPYVNSGRSPDTKPLNLWSEFATWLDGRSWGKGKMRGLCETGFHNGHPDTKGARFWQQAPAAARELDLSFITYFHRNSGPRGNYTMENMPQTRKAFAAAMRELNN